MNHLLKLSPVFLLFFCLQLQAQTKLDSIALQYEKNAKNYKEIVYCHLNKIKFIKGENIAFKAYVLNKNTSKLSNITSNLYCKIIDKENNIIKEGLFYVNKGTNNNFFKIDSTFTSAKYYFQAYTNWQRNANKNLAFSQEIEVLDFNTSTKTKKLTKQNLDIQALPESGNLVAGINNNIGLIIKNEFGKGVIPEKISLKVNNQEKQVLKVNQFGLGKFSLVPNTSNKYQLEVKYRGNDYTIDLPKIQLEGTLLNVSYLRDKLAIKAATTKSKLDNTLVIHNTVNSKLIRVASENNEVTQIISFKDLFKGVNILTLLDNQNNPIAERMVFNFNTPTISKPDISLGKLEDSLRVTIKIPKNIKTLNSSIAILPASTKAANQTNNIVSHLKLQHFLKGNIENPNYYFTHTNYKKKYELDLLCMTQGWSKYDLNTLTKKENHELYEFEKGIDLNFNINKYNTGNFIIHKLVNSKTMFINLTEEDLLVKPKFEVKSLYIQNNEKLNISEIDKTGKLKKASVAINFKPSRIPNFNGLKSYKLSVNNEFNETINPIFTDEIIELDEVTINAIKKETKYQKLKSKSNGTVDVFNNLKREANMQFSSYIASKGFLVKEELTTGALTILNTRRTTLGGLQPPLIFLDDVLLSDFSILSNFTMDIVDYIEIDKTGFGQGIRGATGFIKIYTDPSLRYANDSYRNFEKNTIKPPLGFTSNKTYYTPKYYTYQSNTFKHYGILKWMPNVNFDENGLVYINIPNTKADNIYISMQGIDENGNYILFEDIVNTSNK